MRRFKLRIHPIGSKLPRDRIVYASYASPEDAESARVEMAAAWSAAGYEITLTPLEND